MNAVEKLDPVGARRRVAEDMGQDWVKDPIYRSDILQSLADDPGRIIRRLVDGSGPKRGLSVPVPKSSLTVRPAVDLPLIDRVAYQSLVDSFAFQILADVPDFVCGWRYAKNPSNADDLASNSVEWRRYEEWLDDYWNEGARYVLVTDIAGFFSEHPARVDKREIRNPDGDSKSAIRLPENLAYAVDGVATASLGIIAHCQCVSC